MATRQAGGAGDFGEVAMRLDRRRARWLLLLLSVVMTSAAGGCQSGRNARRGEPTSASAAFANGPTYRVGVGDRLRLACRDGSAGRVLEIAGDGCIPLDDAAPPCRLWVDQATVGEIERKLADMVGGRYRGCEVAVERCGSQYVFVLGSASGEARAIPYQGPESLASLLERLDRSKCPRGYRVRVVRPSTLVGTPPQIFAYRLCKRLRFRNPETRELTVQPNDYVYLERDVGRPGELTRRTAWSDDPAPPPAELLGRALAAAPSADALHR